MHTDIQKQNTSTLQRSNRTLHRQTNNITRRLIIATVAQVWYNSVGLNIRRTMKRGWNIWGGGKHQKLARVVASGGGHSQASSSGVLFDPCQHGHGPLGQDPEVDTLLELWSLGILSAVILQTTAASACLVAPRPPMEALAQIGSNGGARGNAHRDLERKLNLGNVNENVAPALYVQLPLWAVRPRRPNSTLLSYPVLLPHALFASMYKHSRGEFDKFIRGSGNLADFWGNVPLGDPRMVGHPVNRWQGPKDTLIPLRIHGDGVPVGKGKKRSLDTISFSSMVGDQGPTWDTQFLMFGIISEATIQGR